MKREMNKKEQRNMTAQMNEEILVKAEEVKRKLKELVQHETRSMDLSAEIGGIALEMKALIQAEGGKWKEMALELFGIAYARVNECIALCRAKEAGLSSDVLKTNQVLIGQALGSPDVTRKEKAQRMIAEQKFVYLGQTVDINAALFSQVRGYLHDAIQEGANSKIDNEIKKERKASQEHEKGMADSSSTEQGIDSALLVPEEAVFVATKDEKAGSDGLETEDGVEEEESSDDFLKELQNEASSIEGISERIKQIKVSFHSKQNSKEQKTAKKIIEYIREIKKLLSELNA